MWRRKVRARAEEDTRLESEAAFSVSRRSSMGLSCAKAATLSWGMNWQRLSSWTRRSATFPAHAGGQQRPREGCGRGGRG